MAKQYETVIGLEVHVELATKTKIFCGCSTAFGGAPNTHTCPVCTGMPGSLPVLNKQVVEYAAAVGLATNCTITQNCKFDRKNYFYPDNPQNYQISQLYLPICRDGHIDIELPDGTSKQVRIHEIHMEEDAGKLVHDDWEDVSLVDYNRSGVPLIEIVSEPDMRSADEVIAYLDKLRLIIQYLGASDCKLQEGSMRADVNLSVREVGSDTFGTRTETKNLNSFSAIARAIEAETNRQIDLIESGEAVVQETRRWDDNKAYSYAMRSKEDARDYRYFPDPDLVPLRISDEWLEIIRSRQPEFKTEKMARYKEEFGIPDYDINIITDSKKLADLFEATTAICKQPKKVSNWIMGETMRILKDKEMEPEDITFSPENLAKLIALVEAGTINGNVAKDIFAKVFDEDIDPDKYVEENGLKQVNDEGALRATIEQIIADNPQSVADYRGGKTQAMGYLVGQTMKAMKGKANPGMVNPDFEGTAINYYKLCLQPDSGLQTEIGEYMKANDFVIKVPKFPDRSVCITDFGATTSEKNLSDGRVNAAAINKAIDELSKQGGGKVIVPAGMWITGPIVLKSNIELHLEKQAFIKFSKDIEEYPLFITNYEGQACIRAVSPITAENAENVAITGEGFIDGSGDLWRPVKQFKVTERQWQAMLKKSPHVAKTNENGVWLPTESAYLGNMHNIQGNTEDVLEKVKEYYDFYRPVMVSLRHCKNVLLEGVTFMNSPAWNIHPFFCENLTVRNVSISNPYYAQNGDGIDVESCKNVHIHDSVFETGDDAICIKSGKNAEARAFEGPCENLYIHNCLVNEGHGGFVIGSEMSRGVRNILVEKCTFIGTDVGVRMKSAMGRGGVIENIEINDIDMVNIKNEAVILTMSYVLNSLGRNEQIVQNNEEDVPYFKNISINRINCIGAETAIKIEPISGRPETISDITIADSVFTGAGENKCDGVNINIVNTRFE